MPPCCCCCCCCCWFYIPRPLIQVVCQSLLFHHDPPPPPPIICCSHASRTRPPHHYHPNYFCIGGLHPFLSFPLLSQSPPLPVIQNKPSQEMLCSEKKKKKKRGSDPLKKGGGVREPRLVLVSSSTLWPTVILAKRKGSCRLAGEVSQGQGEGAWPPFGSVHIGYTG